MFGKFDQLCLRLQKIVEIARMQDGLQCIANLQLDGMDVIKSNYQVVLDNLNKKSVNALSYRDPEVRDFSILSHTISKQKKLNEIKFNMDYNNF